jgi:hypothetical protein
MPNAQMQWHPVVHELWAQEKLVFWRLGFNPTYRREEVLQSLDVICARYGITAITVYEVLGSYDLLWRVWLPKTAVLDEVDRDVKRTLPAFDLELCDHFEVDSIERHWFWAEVEEDVLPQQPKFQEAVLDPRPTPSKLIKINETLDRFNKGEIDYDTVTADEEIADFIERRLLGVRRAEDGIKFAIVISTSSFTASRFSAMEALRGRIVKTLAEATAIRERSLYSGKGFGKFMIFGKVPTKDFYEINRTLIEPIAIEAGLAYVYRTRSETFIGSNPQLQRFSETLSVGLGTRDGEAAEEVDVLAALREGESERMEYKAGAFSNLNRWLHKDDRSDDGRVFKSFATAVVAMLNGEGGLVISGVVEASSRSYDSEPKLMEFPRFADLIVLGLEFEWADWKRQVADEYMNTLRQKLQATIEPDPIDYLTMHPFEVEGRTVCVVSIQKDLPSWFYLRDDQELRFIVRRDASTEILNGPEVDRYKNLRGPRGR